MYSRTHSLSVCTSFDSMCKKAHDFVQFLHYYSLEVMTNYKISLYSLFRIVGISCTLTVHVYYADNEVYGTGTVYTSSTVHVTTNCIIVYKYSILFSQKTYYMLVCKCLVNTLHSCNAVCNKPVYTRRGNRVTFKCCRIEFCVVQLASYKHVDSLIKVWITCSVQLSLTCCSVSTIDD